MDRLLRSGRSLSGHTAVGISQRVLFLRDLICNGKVFADPAAMVVWAAFCGRSLIGRYGEEGMYYGSPAV